jgi:hypothetical protein
LLLHDAVARRGRNTDSIGRKYADALGVKHIVFGHDPGAFGEHGHILASKDGSRDPRRPRQGAGAVVIRVVAVCVLLLGASDADACVPIFAPSSLLRPKFEPADGAQVVSDAFVVECGTSTCVVTATFGVDVTSTTAVSYAGRGAHDATFGVDGAAAQPAMTMAPGAKQLVVAAKLDLWDYRDVCFQTGISARHPVLGGEHKQTVQYVLRFETASTPKATYPSGWELDATHGSDRNETGSRAITELWFTPPAPSYFAGGPFAVAGIASGDGSTFRLRAGWELAAWRPWLVLGAAFDSDAGSIATLAATVEATSRAWVLPLSYGVGGGAIVLVSPDLRAGGRALTSIALGPARLVLSLDVFTTGDASVALLAGGSL